MYVRKTRDVYHLMTNYGYGWENETDEYTLKDAKRVLREYRENCKPSVQMYIKKGRERIAKEE